MMLHPSHLSPPVDVYVLHDVLLADGALVGEGELHRVDDGERPLLHLPVGPAVQQGRPVVQQLRLPGLGELLGQVRRVHQQRCKI